MGSSSKQNGFQDGKGQPGSRRPGFGILAVLLMIIMLIALLAGGWALLRHGGHWFHRTSGAGHTWFAPVRSGSAEDQNGMTPDSLFRQKMTLGGQKQIKGHDDDAIRLFAQAEQLADSCHLYAGSCEARIKTGEIVYDRGNYDSALTLFLQADKLADAHSLPGSKAYALYYIGKYKETKGIFKEASAYYDKALTICRSGGDPHLLALILTSRGKNYISEGKLNLALQYYLEAYQLSENLHDDMLYAQTSSHLGSLYAMLNQYDKALEYGQKAFDRRDDLDNPEGIAKSCNNVGILWHKLKRNDSAMAYFDQALELCKKTHYKKGLVKALVNIGSLYTEEDEDDKAFGVLDTAYQISTEAGFGFGIASSSLNLANLYKKKGQLTKALYYYRVSLAKLDATDYDDMLQNIYRGLYECYSAKKDYQTALQYHVLLLETQKRLLNVENARQLSVLNISFDLERKVKDNEVLRADNELKESLIKRNTMVIWLIVVALAFTLAACFFIYKLNEKLKLANREKDKLFGIISHELRNPLYWTQNLSEVLSKKFREMPAEKVQKSLSALDESAKNAFHLMDNLLQWSRSKLNRIHVKKGDHALRALVTDTAEMYQTIIRYKEVRLSNHIAEDCMVHADADLLGCVIRNLLSNAIKYTPAGGTIEIGCTVSEADVIVEVRDSGTGIPHSHIDHIFSDSIVSATGLMQEKGSGIGLKLCREFVELNSGRIWAESIAGAGTRFFFSVPRAVAPIAAGPATPLFIPLADEVFL